jgi:hypothetical protein
VKPSLQSIMLRKSIGSMESDRTTCSRCRRTPLVGEFLHRLESDQHVCGLCLARLPEIEQAPLSSERMRASERGLAVGRRARAA